MQAKAKQANLNELWIFLMERDGYQTTIKAAFLVSSQREIRWDFSRAVEGQQPHHLAHHSQTEASEYPQKGSTEYPMKLTHGIHPIHHQSKTPFLLAETVKTQRFNLFYLSATYKI